MNVLNLYRPRDYTRDPHVIIKSTPRSNHPHARRRAYVRGYQAALDGHPKNSCPYILAEDTHLRAEWLDGYRNGGTAA